MYTNEESIHQQQNALAIQDLFQTLQQSIASVQSLLFVITDAETEDYLPDVMNDYLSAIAHLTEHAKITCEKLIHVHQKQIHSAPEDTLN